MRPFPRSIRLPARWVPPLVMTLTLAVLGIVIYWGTLHLRQKIRGQISHRDAEILQAVALMEQINSAANDEWGSELENLTDRLNLALQISQLKGVVAARLYDQHGAFETAFPAYITSAALTPETFRQLEAGKPVSRFLAQASLENLLLPGAQHEPSSPTPLLHVWIPVQEPGDDTLLGIIQFVMDGQPIAAEFRQLDASLARHGVLAFCAGGLLIVAALAWAFRRLQKSQGILLRRTQDLLRANEELALGAKTSAVGAVTAHLIHGLTNPLSGLQEFVSAGGTQHPPESDWQNALESTRRMQAMVHEIVSVLNEVETAEGYEITLEEMLGGIRSKHVEPARTAGVALRIRQKGSCTLDNREANLIMLILHNLLRNALEATARDGAVELCAEVVQDEIQFLVQDQGPGFPADRRANPFLPCRSTKKNGNGIGLAICKQLARHLGAEIVLATTGIGGSTFVLRLRPRVAGRSIERSQEAGSAG